jgi:hypothetical protein
VDLRCGNGISIKKDSKDLVRILSSMKNLNVIKFVEGGVRFYVLF